MGDHVGKGFKGDHDRWPWPTFSRSFICKLYLENHLTYRLHALKVHHDGWPWPTFSRSFFSRLYLGNHLTYRLHILHGEPGYQGLQVASWWETLTYFLKGTLIQVISWEPLDLQSSYFAWGTKLPWSLRCSMMDDLDLLSQGHPLAGYSLRTVWPTEFIFCMEDHDMWPWPTFSRSLFISLAYFKVYSTVNLAL
jgi:hypothetical protein